jgi:amidase/aspartyl-tRNA(Asn)/glutamyl-tRNA(Gln) amidotransferase subunit A
MRELSIDDLVELGERYGVPLREAEAATVRAETNAFLASMAGLDELTPPTDGHDTAARSWREPTDDPHHALAVECDVPPPPRAGTALADVAVGVKDVIAVAGVPMQCGSAVMQGYVPGFDAAVVERLLDAGAHVTAITACDEFAGSSRGTTGYGGPTTNPFDPDRTAGGSSGGSAVAVATGRVDVALGTDTGGSVRVPAAFCGVVGLKPTYGLVPLHGVVENTYTQDHVGPLATSVREAARVLDAVAGPDDRDPASLQAAVQEGYRTGEYAAAVADPPAVEAVTLGLLESGLADGVTPDVAARTEAAVADLAAAGAAVSRVDVEGFGHGRAVKNVLSATEIAAHWAAGGAPYRRGGLVDAGYQAELAARAASSGASLGSFYKSKLLAGAHVIEARDGRPYTRAQAAREVLRERFDEALADVDALVLPTTPDVAPRLAAVDEPAFDYARNTRAADVTRLPAITLPNGTVDGLPVGLQLVGGAFEEASLLGTAAAVESTLPGTGA